MVQIIESNREPSIAEKFGRAFSSAGRTAAQQIPQHLMEIEKKKLQKQQYNQENEAIQKLIGKDISGIRDPKMRQALLDMALEGASQEQRSSSDFNAKQSLLQKEQDFQREMASLKGEGKGADKEELKRLEHEQVRNTAQNSFNTLAKILKKGNVGKGSGILGSLFGGETSKDTGEFASATGGLEAMLVDMVSKGALSDTRFKYITETLLPKPTDRESEIEGKLKGLAQILNLDPSELGLSEKKSSNKGSNKKSLQDIFG